jgi:hypothetical protein
MARGKLVLGIQCQEKNDLIKSGFCLGESYNRDMPPFLNSTPLEISVAATFQSIASINDDDRTVTFDMFLEITWIEPRLEIIYNTSNWYDQGADRWIFFGTKQLENLWRPDLDIVNAKKFEIKNILENQEYAILSDSKRIMYGFTAQLMLNCPGFEFSDYPFDAQFCELWIGSFYWNTERVLYRGDMTYNESSQHPLEYEVKYIVPLSFEEGMKDYRSTTSLQNGVIEYYTERYSHFAIKMKFTRRAQKYLIDTYIPSFLIVLSSWLGFLIGTSSIPGRLTVTVVLLLVLINMR